MNIVKEQMFVNIMANKFDLFEFDILDEECSKIIFHLKYNKCLTKINDNYIITKIPLELYCMKKFIRKITYNIKDKKFILFPVNEDIKNVIIYK